MITISDVGGFQLVAFIITALKDHMICYKFKWAHWWKIYCKKDPFQDLLSSLNAVISTPLIRMKVKKSLINSTLVTTKMVSKELVGLI